jgi:hypothetical protein
MYALLSETDSQTFTSLTASSLIDLSNVSNLLNITIIPPSSQATFNLATSPSVLLALRQIIELDFASRTSFNTTEILDFDPPQFWIGA